MAVIRGIEKIYKSATNIVRVIAIWQQKMCPHESKLRDKMMYFYKEMR